MSLRAWAGRTWVKLGVEAACLALQDEHEQCVPLLFWGLWLVDEEVVADEASLDHAVGLCRTAEITIRPLRGAGRAASGAERKALLARELEAEHELMDQLALLPMREKVAAKPPDEGSRQPLRVPSSLSTEVGETTRLLIRPASRATFSRKGTREMLAELSARWGHPLTPDHFIHLIAATRESAHVG